MEIKVEKLTDVSLLQRANSFTTGRDSHMDLAKAYRYGHSPIRTQLFWIEMRDIPLFCASQFVRSKVGVEWYQRSKRTDRGGEDFARYCPSLAGDLYHAIEHYDWELIRSCLAELIKMPDKFDRNAPTDLACLINAEAIINMSHKRLCAKASKETRDIWKLVLCELWNTDKDLFSFCVKPCIACGVCKEPKTCGYMNTEHYIVYRKEYLRLFE